MDIADLAEERIVAETASALRRNARALAACGAAECVDCEEPIAPARRAALPSARRCAPCQASAERDPRGVR